jgi:hypothetical protein
VVPSSGGRILSATGLAELSPHAAFPLKPIPDLLEQEGTS